MKTIVIYPGKFQPPHRGHYGVYKHLRQKFGPDVYIAISDRTPTPNAPLNSREIEHVWTQHNVPATHIIFTENWKHPVEIFQMVSPEHTIAIFALKRKEIELLSRRKSVDDNGKELWTKVDGSPEYFQLYKGHENNMEPLSKHGYVVVADDIKVAGQPISTKNVREVLGSSKYSDDSKKRFFKWAFGWYNQGLYQMLSQKFKPAYQASMDIEDVPGMPSMASLIKPKAVPTSKPAPQTGKPSITTKAKSQLQQVVREMLKELMSDEPPPTDSGAIDTSAAQRRKEAQKAKVDLSKSKMQGERDLKTMQQDLKWKKASTKQLEKDKLPGKRKELDAINKQIANPSADTTTDTTVSTSNY